ncbi:MAG: hypothetical protein C4543_04465 [Ignavibacteriales bacterium]|nr:MAG: hypothetical protein C4543_04465 [Ignavibacteriales bacterium]
MDLLKKGITYFGKLHLLNISCLGESQNSDCWSQISNCKIMLIEINFKEKLIPDTISSIKYNWEIKNDSIAFLT